MKTLYIALTILFSAQILIAESHFETKLELSHTECQLNKSVVYIDIYIRKQDEIDKVVLLKNQNYRVDFISNSLVENSFFIEAEGALSSFGTNADPSSYFLFGGHNLTGSTGNVLSYNIDFLGGDGYELPSEWTLVGTVGATLKSNIECFSSVLMTGEAFPPTTLIYDITDALNEVDHNPQMIDLNECLKTQCNLCHNFLQLNEIESDYLDGELLHHEVQDYIQAQNKIGKNANIIYDVKNYGMLNPGFEVELDAKFEIDVKGCPD